MANYKKKTLSEVEILARQDDGDALYEMAWRPEAKPTDIPRNDPVYNCAWQDYWWGKAADVGHADARDRYARSLVNDRPFDSEWRQKAMGYFEESVREYDAGKLKEDMEIIGIIAKLYLGMMLCQGLGTRRDVAAGNKLLQEADSLTKGFAEFGYKTLSSLTETYGQGCVQEDGEPTVDDLRQAIALQRKAIGCFNQQKNDPNNRGYLGLANDYLKNLGEWKELKESQKDTWSKMGVGSPSSSTTVSDGFKKWQEGVMQVPPAVQQRIKADKDALAHIQLCMARLDW